MTNPYSAPVQSAPAAVDVLCQDADSFGEIARRTFLAWEKMRLIYIGLCAVPTFLLGTTGATETLDSIQFWIPVLVGALIANLFYFVGPVVETYVTWLGYPSKSLRWTLFVLGTLFTVVMAIGALVSLLPSPN